MTTGNKIILFGMGRTGRLIYSGADALHTAGFKSVNIKSDLDSLTKIISKHDYKTLVNAYKQVRKKYYPERDLFKKI